MKSTAPAFKSALDSNKLDPLLPFALPLTPTPSPKPGFPSEMGGLGAEALNADFGQRNGVGGVGVGSFVRCPPLSMSWLCFFRRGAVY